jgi:hypothetical protein
VKAMKERKLTLPEIFLIASTRGMLGAGVGLLLAEKFEKKSRQTVGWSLLLIGALSTIPLAIRVLGNGE